MLLLTWASKSWWNAVVLSEVVLWLLCMGLLCMMG
jgi:hypothetical protein